MEKSRKQARVRRVGKQNSTLASILNDATDKKFCEARTDTVIIAAPAAAISIWR